MTPLRVGDRVRVARIYAPGYPQSWVGLVGTVTAVLGEIPTYGVKLDGIDHPFNNKSGGAAFLREELEPSL